MAPGVPVASHGAATNFGNLGMSLLLCSGIWIQAFPRPEYGNRHAPGGRSATVCDSEGVTPVEFDSNGNDDPRFGDRVGGQQISDEAHVHVLDPLAGFAHNGTDPPPRRPSAPEAVTAGRPLSRKISRAGGDPTGVLGSDGRGRR